jgi:hypothetical protein
LRGEEAALVRTAIDAMINTVLLHIDDEFDDPGDVCESGIPVYDHCTTSQKIGLLHDVARYLLTETESTLPLSAAVEAAVAAVFVEIRDQVAIEIELFSMRSGEVGNGQPTWRQMVLDAYQTMIGPGDDESDDWDEMSEELPDRTCKDMDQWECLIDALADAILWDRDFEMAEGFLDADPGVSQQRRRLLGIDEDYFTSVAPDPRPHEVLRLISETRDIVRAKPR